VALVLRLHGVLALFTIAAVGIDQACLAAAQVDT